MPRTHTHTHIVYTFEELSDDAKSVALDHMREKEYHVDDDYWYEHMFDHFKEIGSILGIEIKNIYFTGFWHQGDGACFEGSYSYQKGWRKKLEDLVPEYEQRFSDVVDIAETLQEVQRRHFYKLSASVDKTYRSCHSRSPTITVSHDDCGWWWDSHNPVDEDEVKEALRSYMDWMYKSLQDEYEYRTSDECLTETAIDLELEFYATGKLY